MRKGFFGLLAGLVAALGGAWLAKRLMGSDETTDHSAATGSTALHTEPLQRREGLDPTLLEILACPDDKQPVIYQKEGDAERLTCTVCGKRYPVRDGIPVMLIDEAETGPLPTEAEIAAAKALAPEGKPAIVGAAPVDVQSAAQSSAAAGTTTEASAASTASSEAVEKGKPLDAGSGVG